jgi:predicted GIY-YIG superfamily endonuclease
MSDGYIYILGSQIGTLYIGVTSNLYLRAFVGVSTKNMQNKLALMGRSPTIVPWHSLERRSQDAF